ncbi:hypothetical protein B0H19DRAFT_1294007 [Mycena capillaripes]|nr:hypothetical protein B0H19DRAFT_1294007 [Mycena capillaripes]
MQRRRRHHNSGRKSKTKTARTSRKKMKDEDQSSDFGPGLGEDYMGKTRHDSSRRRVPPRGKINTGRRFKIQDSVGVYEQELVTDGDNYVVEDKACREANQPHKLFYIGKPGPELEGEEAQVPACERIRDGHHGQERKMFGILVTRPRLKIRLWTGKRNNNAGRTVKPTKVAKVDQEGAVVDGGLARDQVTRRGADEVQHRIRKAQDKASRHRRRGKATAEGSHRPPVAGRRQDREVTCHDGLVIGGTTRVDIEEHPLATTHAVRTAGPDGAQVVGSEVMNNQGRRKLNGRDTMCAIKRAGLHPAAQFDRAWRIANTKRDRRTEGERSQKRW